jgi:DNA-binding response OmpR family regulator
VSSDNTKALHILLVDDDGAIRALSRKVLEMQGWMVTEAGEGCEAIKAAHTASQSPDIAVIDLYLPDANGPDIAAEMLKQNPALKVIYITGDPGSLPGLTMGRDSVLPKPFTPKQLVKAIREARDMRG